MLQQDTMINGRYRIVRTIGSGGMGSVYAAHDERLGRQVALKLLRADLASDPRARERFLREAQIAAQLIHPNIVRTYDVGDAPEGPYLVQELLHGRTLDTLIPLPSKHAIELTRQIADALGYIHGQGYVHCDIKPQNVMLVGASGAEQRAVLLDFGIARVEGTATTTLIATPHYLAPELAMGSAPTAASDWYALGIVLYHMLTDHPPFDGPTIHTIIEQHRTAPLPPLKIAAGAGPQETSALEAIIRKLTAKQPEERYTSATALRNDLASVQAGAVHAMPTVVVGSQPRPAPAAPRPVAEPRVKASVPPPAAAVTAEQPRRDRRLWLLGLPLVLLLLAGTALMRDRTPDTSANPQSSPSTAPSPTTPSAVAVPDVVNLPVEEAQRQITEAGLVFVQGEAIQGEQAANIVLSTDPSPGQPVAPGSQVIVQVSAGPIVVAPPGNDGDDGGDDDDDKKDDKDKGKKNKGKKDD
ncbi:MAG TPA: protein kinase [Herpetosiphonaceae bacterium]